MIYSLVDWLFNIFMWMLIEPDGQRAFMTFLASLFVLSSGYLIYEYWRDDEMEKPRGSGDTGTQRKGTESEDKGAE